MQANTKVKAVTCRLRGYVNRGCFVTTLIVHMLINVFACNFERNSLKCGHAYASNRRPGAWVLRPTRGYHTERAYIRQLVMQAGKMHSGTCSTIGGGLSRFSLPRLDHSGAWLRASLKTRLEKRLLDQRSDQYHCGAYRESKN